jgi:hypothetical protein
MTVTVRATEVNGIMPRAMVFDDNENPVPALVLAHGGGTETIQVAAAPPGTDYFVMVREDATSGKVAGNYNLNVDFGRVAANPVTFVESSLDGARSQRSYDLFVTQTQLFDWLLAAPASVTPPDGVVRMDIVNSAGVVVATRSVAPGDVSGGDPVLLSPGIYQARFVAASTGTAPLSLMPFQLYGASLSDPIGPALDDPTLNPVATPAVGVLLTGLPAVPGSSGSPYYWLALVLNGPDASGLIEGQDQAPTAGGTTFATLAAPGTAVSLGNGVALGTSAKDGTAPTDATASPSVSTGAVASRVVVTYALDRVLLLTSLITSGPLAPVIPEGPLAGLPGVPEGTAGAGIVRLVREATTASARVEPQGSQVPGTLVGDIPPSEPAPGVARPGSPDEPYEGRGGGKVGCGAAEILTIVWITAILYRYTHCLHTETRRPGPRQNSKDVS